MNTKKFALIAVFCTLIYSVFGDAANILVSFSTPGPDKYADGTTVLDNEWYALVWSQDGNFEGLNLDLTPVDANDKVVMMYPIAKNGRCPYVVFQIDSKSDDYKTDGEYAVYMLDTRNAAKDAAAKADASGLKPAAVNAAVAVAAYTKNAGTSGSTTVSAAKTTEWAASVVDTNVPGYTQPKIEAFEIVGAQVKITVSGMMPGINYAVKMGDAPDKLNTYSTETKTAGDATFFIDQNQGKFFQVVREPLKK